ncbi:MAG: hypothetical protein AABY22_30980 [Nanoarchaeota archaeon]
MSKKFLGYKENDTFWDEHHRKNGLMTNREFFSNNAKDGFYEGMEWDGEKWGPNAESRRKTAEYEATLCQECHCKNCVCW